MTQPSPLPDSNTAQILAAAAIALALIEVERQVRQDVHDTIDTALAAFAAFLLLALAAPAVVITGIALLSLATVHKALTSTIEATRGRVRATVNTAYTSAAQVAQAKVTADLAQHGYTVPSTLPELGTTRDTILRDVDTMFGHAQTDLQNTIRAAYDSTQDPNGRILAVRQAIDAATARLQQRAAAATSTAVYRGSTDAQQAIYTEFQNTTGTTNLYKRWRVTASDPCGMCAALNGTIVGINAEFDHTATTVDKDLRPVWRNLTGPPRHPNCRCQLELVRL